MLATCTTHHSIAYEAAPTPALHGAAGVAHVDSVRTGSVLGARPAHRPGSSLSRRPGRGERTALISAYPCAHLGEVTRPPGPALDWSG